MSPKGIQCHVTSRDREVIGNAKLKASAMRERQRQKAARQTMTASSRQPGTAGRTERQMLMLIIGQKK